jgi:hypothetical protein
VELVLAHPTGVTEIEEGAFSVDGSTLEIEVCSTTIALTTSAKSVTGLARSIRVAGDELTYTVRMAAVGQPLRHHLSATLHRTNP